jgi:hypothetical protein
MLAKCVNPSCSTPFRYLEEGRLFRLESDRPLGLPKREKSEYFWLCSLCSRTMTLRLDEPSLDEPSGVVVTRYTDTAPHVADRARFMLLDRQRGLLLTSLEGALFFARAS